MMFFFFWFWYNQVFDHIKNSFAWGFINGCMHAHPPTETQIGKIDEGSEHWRTVHAPYFIQKTEIKKKKTELGKIAKISLPGELLRFHFRNKKEESKSEEKFGLDVQRHPLKRSWLNPLHTIWVSINPYSTLVYKNRPLQVWLKILKHALNHHKMLKIQIIKGKMTKMKLRQPKINTISPKFSLQI